MGDPSTLEPADIHRFLAFSHQLADLSGHAILPYFRQPMLVENKDGPQGYDPVTAADRAAEDVISRAVAAAWPGHGFVGEELGQRNEQAHYRWVVDPIDGTRSFIMGSPLWGTLIGLMGGPEPLFGMMDQPFTRERYWSDEQRSYVRSPGAADRPLQTRPCTRIEDALLATTHPDLFGPGEEAEAFARLKGQARMTRYGGDCYAYCLLAAGFIDIIVEAGLKPYDIVALIPVIERAGGRVTTWDGHPASAGGRIIASGDPRLHDLILNRLAKRV